MRTWMGVGLLSVCLAACGNNATGTGGAAGGGSGGSAASGGGGNVTSTGGEGSTGGTATGGVAGQGGSGGDAGSTNATGGIGGAGGTAGMGGTAGEGGCMADPYVCDPKDCGLVANECGLYSNCNVDENGNLSTCKTQPRFFPGGSEGGPMTCNPTTHRCECAPGSAEAQTLCNDAALPSVTEWCIKQGGCVAAYCGETSGPKVPDSCNGSGQFESNGAKVWCCAKPCVAAADCDDQNECTSNACSAAGLCAFEPTPQMPCNGGAGVCINGKCEMF